MRTTQVTVTCQISWRH